jgi:hypothetical protein
MCAGSPGNQVVICYIADDGQRHQDQEKHHQETFEQFTAGTGVFQWLGHEMGLPPQVLPNFGFAPKSVNRQGCDI